MKYKQIIDDKFFIVECVFDLTLSLTTGRFIDISDLKRIEVRSSPPVLAIKDKNNLIIITPFLMIEQYSYNRKVLDKHEITKELYDGKFKYISVFDNET